MIAQASGGLALSFYAPLADQVPALQLALNKGLLGLGSQRGSLQVPVTFPYTSPCSLWARTTKAPSGWNLN